jgi:hypothetical protein
MSAFGSLTPVQKKVLLALRDDGNPKIEEHYIYTLGDGISERISETRNYFETSFSFNYDATVVYKRKELADPIFDIQAKSVKSMISKGLLDLHELRPMKCSKVIVVKFRLSETGREYAERLYNKKAGK